MNYSVTKLKSEKVKADKRQEEYILYSPGMDRHCMVTALGRTDLLYQI